MASSVRTDITIGAKLHELQKSLAGMEGIGAKEAKKMVSAMEKEWKRNEANAKKAASSSSGAWIQGWQAAGTAAMAGGGVMVAAVGSVASKVVQLQQRIADLVNDLSDMEARTGVSAKTLGGLRLAAEGAGAKLSDMEGGFRKLSTRMRDAQTGTGKSADAFKALGVSVTDSEGKLRTTEDTLKDTWRALQAIENPTERAAIGTDLLGSAYGALAQSLGDADLDDHARLAQLIGVNHEKAAESAALWQRQMAALSTAVDGATETMLRHFDISEAVDGAVILIGLVRRAWEETVARSTDLLKGYGNVVKSVLTGDFAGWQDALAGIGATLKEGASATLNAGMEIQKLQQRTQTTTEATKEHIRAGKQQADQAEDTGRKVKGLADALREQQRATDAAVASAQRMMGAQDTLRSIIRQATSDTLSDLDRVELAYADMEEAILKVAMTSGDLNLVQQAFHAAEQRRARDTTRIIGDSWVQATSEAADAIGDLEAATRGIYDALQQAEAELRAERQATLQMWHAGIVETMGTASMFGAYMEQSHAMRIDEIREQSNARTEAFKAERQGERDHLDDLLRRGKINDEQHARMMADLKEANREKRQSHREERKSEYKEMIRGWKAQQRAQKAQAWIDYGRAITALIPSHSFAGPLAPGAAAATASIAHGMALKQINAQKPPAFPMGGMVADRLGGPDHTVIQARLDEGIVSPRGMSHIGSQGLDAINRGEAPSNQVTIQLGRRTLAEAVDATTGTVRVGRRTGQVPVYGGG